MMNGSGVEYPGEPNPHAAPRTAARCPRCLQPLVDHAGCCPGVTPVPTLEPRWRDIFIGHLHLLAQPSPTKILGCMVKGPTWYQTPAQQGQAWGPGSRCACKLHKGSAVWLWEGYLDQLPALGSAGDEGPTADYTRMLGGLQSSQVLIVHLPGSSKRFRGKYRLERGQPLEQNGERLIDNLQDHLEHLSFPINGIICIAGEVGMENGAPNREELRFQELISTRLRSLVPIFIISPNLPAAMDSLSGLLPDITPQTNLLWPANGDVVTEHGSVEIFDVGGALGYGLLADMHMDFPPGNQPNAMGRLMRRAMAALTRIFKTGARAQLPPLPYVHDGVRVSWSGSTLQGTSWAEQ